MAMKTAQKLWDLAWELLIDGQDAPQSPFGTPVIATTSTSGIPHSRVVVLREADKNGGKLLCYTDRRSAKVAQLSGSSSVMSWTFWSPEHQVQFTCYGQTTELSERICREKLLSLPKHSRRPYAALFSPGSKLAEAGDGLPENWHSLSLKETNYAAKNFLILCTKITRAEILQLSRDGNKRLRAERDEHQKWDFQWLVP